MTLNPTSLRFPFNISGLVHPQVENALRWAFNGLDVHEQAFREMQSNIDTLTAASNSSTSSSSSSSTSGVTTSQATTIANTQASTVIAQTFGTVNPQTGTAYTAQTGDYAGLITFNNAAPVGFTLNSTVAPQWFTAMENLGAGTVTVTPDTGLINGVATLSIPTGAGALIYRNPDGTNWSAILIPAPSAGGVTSLDGITGAITLIGGAGITITDNTPAAGDITIAATAVAGVTSLQTETGAITLTSSGATVVITTPTSGTINLESTGGGGGLPTNNPTFTGLLTGPAAAINHLENTGTSPTVTLLGPAGSGATVSNAGNDTSGLINLTAGSGASAGNIATVTLSTGFPTTIFALVTGFNSSTFVAQSFVGFPSGGGGAWELGAGFAMVSGQNYTIQYIVFGN